MLLSTFRIEVSSLFFLPSSISPVISDICLTSWRDFLSNPPNKECHVSKSYKFDIIVISYYLPYSACLVDEFYHRLDQWFTHMFLISKRLYGGCNTILQSLPPVNILLFLYFIYTGLNCSLQNLDILHSIFINYSVFLFELIYFFI